MKDKKLWALFVAFAFAAIISGVQISSYHADKYNLNGLYWVVCPVFALLAAWTLYRLIKRQ